MMERLSYWTRISVLPLVLLLGSGAAEAAVAQADLGDVCTAAIARYECQLATATAAVIQPRVGLALWGGNPVPGTASTGGLRLAGSPRIGVAVRFAAVPTTLPPLLDRTVTGSETGIVTSAALQSTVAVTHGFSPLPTVGGFLSVDVTGRLAVARLPGGSGFSQRAVWGGMAGVRLGLLRESFTLPGVSLTAAYGRSTRVTFGDPEGLATDGFIRGSVSDLNATLAASRRLFGLLFTGGVAWDRYSSELDLGHSGGAGILTTDAVMERWSGFGSLTWTRLIYHGVVELGWQDGPPSMTLPAGVNVDPAGIWLALAFRVTP